jgi:hypothetical protein
MKKILTLFILMVPMLIFAQPDTLWRFSGITSLNLNQIGLSNWTAGGNEQVAFSLLGKYYANYKKDKFTWDNNLNIMYGMFKNKGEKLKKNDDVFELTSMAGQQIAKRWAFVGMVNFKSQFTKGYDTDIDTLKVSNFMAPGYLTVSPAFRYSPVDWFYILLSPVTLKSTFVLDQELADAGAFGVQAAEYDTTSGVKLKNGKNSLLYLGPFMEAYMKKELVKNLVFESKLNVLYSLTNRDETNLEPLDMDVSWQNFLNYNIAKYFSISLFAHLVYYPGQPVLTIDNVDGVSTIKAEPNRKWQFKETVGIGISFSFANVIAK